MSYFAIAGLQLDLSGKDNRYLIQKAIESTRRRYPWIDMILLGELATFGPDLANAQVLPGEIEAFYGRIARENEVWLVPGSVYEREDDNIYNTCSVFDPEGRVVGRHRKLFPFLPYEKGVSAGDDYLVFDVPGIGRFGVCICYDQWFPETARTLAWLGAEVILCPTMTNTIDREVELALARANAVANQCYFFNTNVAGGLGNGQSIVVGPDGAVLHLCDRSAQTVPIEIDLDYVRRIRERGMYGLGQALKSFRDSEMPFPAHQGMARRDGPLAELGKLEMPSRASDLD